MADVLPRVPEDWSTALAVIAHPDDMEYGAASAVARWVGQGKSISYVLATDGEAGISTIPPDEVAPLRRAEQIASCAAVGVTEVEFLGLPDGLLVESLDLRRTLTDAIRRHRPDVLLSINHHDSWGGPSWNHADHRVIGRSLLDVADTLDAGIASLRCHEIYLSNLGGAMADPDEFLRTNARSGGELVGVELATTFELVHL